MSHTSWEADKMLDVYIYDYLMKRQLHVSARTFQAEGNVPSDPVAIDAPGGFLFEWWSVFWDIFIARTDQKHSEAAASYNKSQQSKAQEMQKQQENQKLQLHQQIQMQLLLQRHAQQQQQRRGGAQLVRGSANCPISNDSSIRQNHTTSNAMATKVYEDRLKLPLQTDALDDAALKQKIGGNVDQLLDPKHASLLKAVVATTGRQDTGQTLLGAHSILHGNPQLVQRQNQLLSVSTKGIKSNMDPIMRSQAAVPEGSIPGVHGSNECGTNLTLKGWPLAGLDQLRSGLLQQNTLMQTPQSLNQLSQEQQLMLQEQRNLVSQSVSDLDSRSLRVLLNNQNMGLEKDGPSNSQDVQNSGQQLPQYSQRHLSHQLSHNLMQQDKIGSGSMPSTLQVNDQASKTHIGRKRKQASSSGPANSSGTANTTGPSASSPSTPSTQTPGDVMSVPALQKNALSLKSLLMSGADGLDSVSTAHDQLGEMDRLVGDASLGDNVESFFLPDKADLKEFSFKETKRIMASTLKVECCHFSSDGKFLATGGHDKKASLWCTESFNLKSTLDEHAQWITDVRFSPSMSRIATSSADKTVRVWDSNNPGCSLRTFTGHSTTVLSLDFHPSKDDLISSCDNNEIRYWSIKNGSCAGVFKGGATQMRFQPGLGRLLAAAVDNLISVLDVETLGCRLKLQGHNDHVRSVCWDSSGKYLASVSDDLVRVWTVGSSGSKGECIHELNAYGNMFNTCTFHPFDPVLIIGCHETIELWNFSESRTMTLRAHDKLVSSLAVSNVTGLVASASHDKHVKIWK